MEHGRASDLTILTRLAVGGMAEIFLARKGAQPEGNLVVVKRILPQYAEEGRFLRMLFDEASISLNACGRTRVSKATTLWKIHGRM